MFRFKLILLICFQALCLGGCLKVSKKAKSESPKVENSGAEMSPQVSAPSSPPDSSAEISTEANSITTELSGLPEFSSYQLHIRFPESQNVQIRIQKTLDAKIESFDLPSGVLEWKDATLKSGQVLRFDIGQMVNGQFLIRKTESIQVPMDLEFQEDTVLSAEELTKRGWSEEEVGGKKWIHLKNHHRIFFAHQATLTTLGRNVLIEAESVHFHSAVLRSFTEDQIAENSMDGRSGGTLTIKAKSATGEVSFEMRGENGGHGTPAKTADDSLRGAQGVAGYAPSYQIEMIPCPPSSEICLGPTPLMICTSPTPQGGPGQMGLRGYPGGNGGKGGDSGRLSLQIEDLTKLAWSNHAIPGDGGERAVGGEGGQGGPGGAAWGRAVMTRNCSQGAKGNSGPPGPPGADGTPGRPGRTEPQCVLENGQLKCSSPGNQGRSS